MTGICEQDARKSRSSKDAAWALRYSFDDVLNSGGYAIKSGTGRDSARKIGVEADVGGKIREAISIGVPLYNAGDHASCAQVYEVCLRDLEPGTANQCPRSKWRVDRS